MNRRKPVNLDFLDEMTLPMPWRPQEHRHQVKVYRHRRPEPVDDPVEIERRVALIRREKILLRRRRGEEN